MGHWRGTARGVFPTLLSVVCLLGATGARRTPAVAPGLPLLIVDDATTREGDADRTALVFTLRLSGPAADTVWVSFETGDGTARVADDDYDAASGRLAFPPGSLAESLAVLAHGDTLPEDDEWLSLRLSEPVGAAFADSEAVGVLPGSRSRADRSPRATAPHGRSCSTCDSRAPPWSA